MLRLLQHPVLLVLLCFSLIGTPVTYRGGASNPHAHMFLEFLMEAESGKFDHHHHGEAEESEEADYDAGEHHHEPESDVSPSQTVGSTEHFGASVSAFVVGDVGLLAFILPEHLLPQSSQIDSAFAQGNRVLSGITHSPTAPPPR